MFFSGVCECVNWIQLAQGPSRVNRDVDLSFEKLGNTDQTSRRHIPKESNLQLYRCENLKFSNLRCLLKGGEMFSILCGISRWSLHVSQLGELVT